MFNGVFGCCGTLRGRSVFGWRSRLNDDRLRAKRDLLSERLDRRVLTHMNLLAQNQPALDDRDFLKHRNDQRVAFVADRGRIGHSAIDGDTLDHRLLTVQRRFYGVGSCVNALTDPCATLHGAFAYRGDFFMKRKRFGFLGMAARHRLLDACGCAWHTVLRAARTLIRAVVIQESHGDR